MFWLYFKGLLSLLPLSPPSPSPKVTFTVRCKDCKRVGVSLRNNESDADGECSFSKVPVIAITLRQWKFHQFWESLSTCPFILYVIVILFVIFCNAHCRKTKTYEMRRMEPWQFRSDHCSPHHCDHRGTALGRKSWHSKTSPVSSAWTRCEDQRLRGWDFDVYCQIIFGSSFWRVKQISHEPTNSPSLTIISMFHHPFYLSLAVSCLRHFMHFTSSYGTPMSSRLWAFHLKVLGWRNQGKFSFGNDAEIRRKKESVRNM